MLKNTLILFLVILLTISSIAYSLGLNDLPISMLDNIRNVFRKFFTATTSSADGWSQCITPLTQTCTQYCQSQGKTCSNTCNNGYGVNKGVLCYQNANCPANDPLIASTSAGAWCGDSCYGYASGKCCCSGSSSATTTTTTTIACPGLCYSYYPPFSSWTCTNNICNYDIESLSDHYNCPISQPICTIYRSKVTCGATNNDCLSRCSQSGCAGATTTTSTTTTIPTTTTTILKTTSTTQPTLSTTTTTENNDFDILNFGCTKSLGNHKCSLEYSNNLNNGANIVFFYVDNHGAVIKSTINFVQKGNGKMEELFICNLFEKGSYKVFYKIYELIPRIEVGNENLKNPKKWAKTTEIKEVVC